MLFEDNDEDFEGFDLDPRSIIVYSTCSHASLACTIWENLSTCIFRCLTILCYQQGIGIQYEVFSAYNNSCYFYTVYISMHRPMKLF